MVAVRALALLALLPFSGCIQFVEDDGSARPQSTDEVAAAVVVASPEPGRVEVSIVRAPSRAAYDLADENRTRVEFDGLRCRGVLAGGDTRWEVGEAVSATSATELCGLVVERGARLQVKVFLGGSVVHDAALDVR